MKTFLIFGLLAMVATMAAAQFYPSEQYQPYPEQQPWLQGQQPWLQGQQPFIQGQQQFLQGQQPFIQGQQPFYQPFLQQQLNPCRVFFAQQCSSVPTSSCQMMQQQCCQQLAQIPEQHRCPAVNSIVDAIFMQQQQQQYFQPQQQPGFFQPQQQQLGHMLVQPLQQAQLVAMKVSAHQTLSAMCRVQIPLYCTPTTLVGGISSAISGISAGLGGISAGIGGR